MVLRMRFHCLASSRSTQGSHHEAWVASFSPQTVQVLITLWLGCPNLGQVGLSGVMERIAGLRPDSDRDPVTGLRPGQAEFIDWLTDPERKGSQNEWGRQHGVSSARLSKWKREDPYFQNALRKRLVELNLDPASVQDIINAMRKQALQGDVQAARLVLEYMKFLNPTAGQEAPTAAVEDMSDIELQAEIEKELAKARGSEN